MADENNNPQENVEYEYVELEEGQELPEGYEYEYEYEYVEETADGQTSVDEESILSEESFLAKPEIPHQPVKIFEQQEETGLLIESEEQLVMPKENVPEFFLPEEEKLSLDDILGDAKAPNLEIDLLDENFGVEEFPTVQNSVTEFENSSPSGKGWAFDNLEDGDEEIEVEVAVKREAQIFTSADDIKFNNDDISEKEEQNWFKNNNVGNEQYSSVDIEDLDDNRSKEAIHSLDVEDYLEPGATVVASEIEEEAPAEDEWAGKYVEVEIPDEVLNEPITEPVVEEVFEEVLNEPITEPVVEEVFEEVLNEPITEPVVEEVFEEILNEPIAEPVVEEVFEEVLNEPIAEPVVEEVLMVTPVNTPAEASVIVDSATSEVLTIEPSAVYPQVSELKPEQYAVLTEQAFSLSKNSGIQAWNGKSGTATVVLSEIDFEQNELSLWNLIIFSKNLLPLKAQVNEIELAQSSKINRLVTLVKNGTQKASFFNEASLRIINATDACVAVDGKFICGDLGNSSGIIVDDFITLPLGNMAGKMMHFREPVSGILSGPQGSLFYFHNLSQIGIPSSTNSKEDAEKLQYRISKWYSGSLNDKYFEFSANSETTNFEGNDEINAIHVNVNNSSYGWNATFDNGLSMNLRDLREYQTRFGKMPSPNGVISYGQVKLTFSKVERVVVYESAQYFFYS